MTLCYWCKNEPCTCRNITVDYPKYMIKHASASLVCKFCKRTDCVCDVGYCLLENKLVNATPLYVTEMKELGIGIDINKETIEKFSLETLRSMGEYTLYYSCHTSNAYLTYDDRIMAIGPSFVLEPFMTLREGLSLKKKKIILDK